MSTASNREGVYTRGFDFTNLSGQTLSLAYTPSDYVESPARGAVLVPGATHRFEVTYLFGRENDFTVAYTAVGSDATRSHAVDFGMRVDSIGIATTACAPAVGDCSHNDRTAAYLDPPGTEISVTDPQMQVKVLDDLCSRKDAKCTFHPVSREEVLGNPRQLGKPVSNPTELIARPTWTESWTEGNSNSIGVEIKAGFKIGDVVEVGIAESYGHSWYAEETFTQSIQVELPPYTRGWVFAEDELYRDTGDFTMKIGNSTWHVRGVVIDSPRPGGHGEYVVKTEPIGRPDPTAVGSHLTELYRGRF